MLLWHVTHFHDFRRILLSDKVVGSFSAPREMWQPGD